MQRPFRQSLFTETPRLKRRLPAFLGSIVFHSLLLLTLALASINAPNNDDAVGRVNRKYSVRFLRLQMAQEHGERSSSGMQAPGAAAFRQGGASKSIGSSQAAPQQRTASASGIAGPVSVAESAATRAHRPFELPPTSRVDPVKQTLVQLDLPPDIVLKHEFEVPTMLLWTERDKAPPRRKFIAPPLKQAPKVAQSLPVPALLEPPNLEVKVADLNIAATVLNDTPHLARPPAVATPVSSAGPEEAKQIPQVSAADSGEATATNLISLPDIPVRPSAITVIPPANQIAPSSGAGSTTPSTSAAPVTGNGTGTTVGTEGSGTQGRGRSASGASVGTEGGSGGGSGSGALSSGNGDIGSGGSNGRQGVGAGSGVAGNGTGGTGAGGASGNGLGGTGSNETGSGKGGTSGNGSGGTLDAGPPGVTRLTLPKEGHFGVVVVGSAAAEPYPESAGTLTGKMVYTVYLKVGLRKSWILQYCLPKSAEQRIATRGSATPIDAPWPFLILRPNHLSAEGEDYVLIHGMITAEGQFDQLAMIFPEELEKKELLISSLNQWEFRPATRDGVRTTVEVLLIIPREPD